jgi:hypothetical protein
LSARNLVFRDVHVNFITAGSLADILFDPSKIEPHFAFLANSRTCAQHYENLFNGLCAMRRGQSSGKSARPITPYIKGVGAMITIADNEVRHSPPYRCWSHTPPQQYWPRLAALGILPYKIIPNLKVSLEENFAKESKLSQFYCRPLIRIYPIGGVAYQLRLRLRSVRGFDLDTFIRIMKRLMDMNSSVLVAAGTTYNIQGLVSALHAKATMDLLGKEDADSHFEFHRIITLDDVNPKPDPAIDSRELCAIMTVDDNFGARNPGFIMENLGKSVESTVQDQFILFNAGCTLIYPAVVREGPKNEVSKSCLRDNLAWVLEWAKVEKALTSDLNRRVKEMEKDPRPSFDQVEERLALLARLKERLVPFNPELDQDWTRRLHGVHRRLHDATKVHLSWKPDTETLLSAIDQLRTTMSLDDTDLGAVDEICNNLLEAGETLRQLEAKANAFSMSKSGITALKNQALDLYLRLLTSTRDLNVIEERRMKRISLQTDQLTEMDDQTRIIAAWMEYQNEFLPNYIDNAATAVKNAADAQQKEPTPAPQPVNSPPVTPTPAGGTSGTTSATGITEKGSGPIGPAPPSGSVGSKTTPSTPAEQPSVAEIIANAQKLATDAVSWKSKIKQAFTSPGAFWSAVKIGAPYAAQALKLVLAVV